MSFGVSFASSMNAVASWSLDNLNFQLYFSNRIKSLFFSRVMWCYVNVVILFGTWVYVCMNCYSFLFHKITTIFYPVRHFILSSYGRHSSFFVEEFIRRNNDCLPGACECADRHAGGQGRGRIRAQPHSWLRDRSGPGPMPSCATSANIPVPQSSDQFAGRCSWLILFFVSLN